MYKHALALWTAIILFGTAVCEQHMHRLKTGETLEIKNHNYPGTSQNVKDIWMLGTSSGGAIKLECDDIRINSKNCDEGRLMVSAGDSPQTICDNRQTYTATSLFESLYIDFELKTGEGAFKCKATALSSPNPTENVQKQIHVQTDSVNGDVSHLKLERMKHYEYAITTDPGFKLIATCGLAHSDSTAKDPCDGLALTLKSTRETKKFCESMSKDIVFHTEDNRLDIDFKTGLLVGTGYMSCSIRSTLIGTHSNYKQIASEEVDSSEHGLMSKRGPKATTCNCGWANKDNRRIIHGYDAGEHEYPWSVSLQYPDGFHFCGGSIISEYHILSAAHCLAKEPEEVQVVVGTNKKDDRRNSYRVKQIIHHNFDKTTAHRDIAILVLEKKIEFNQNIGPVCLPSKRPDTDRQYVTAMGWGRLAEEEYATKDTNLLKETKLRAIDIYSCTEDWNYKWNLKTAQVMCTWSNHTDICLGDSGGPVVWLDPDTNRYTLVGMPALCDSCRLTLPSVHTAVYLFYDWIQTKIAESMQPSGKTCTKIG